MVTDDIFALFFGLSPKQNRAIGGSAEHPPLNPDGKALNQPRAHPSKRIV